MVAAKPAAVPAQDAPIAFIDLAAQQRRLRPALERAMARVLDHGQYVMGPEVARLELALAEFSGARHAVSCASGTDALLMVLLAKGVGRGDAVICPAFTFTATPEAIALLGATPIFADVRADSCNLDPQALPAALATARRHGLAPKAIMAVDLYGQPADYDALERFARDQELWLLADAAQSFGASYRGRKVGRLGLATATSFFPSKPLGGYGDGGAILTDDGALAATLVSIREHGKGSERYDHVRLGINGRLDTLQAAILLEKLAIFADEIARRDQVARRYGELLAGAAVLPALAPEVSSVWAQYTIRVPAPVRDGLRAALAAAGIPTAVHYPKPLHHQPAYRDFPVAAGGAPVAEALAGEVLSLPMHPYLDAELQARIAGAVTRFLG